MCRQIPSRADLASSSAASNSAGASGVARAPPLLKDHLRQILPFDAATVTLRRSARRANHLSPPEKPRQRPDHATILVGENALQLDLSAADPQRRGIEHLCRASGACIRAGHDRSAGGESGWAWRIHRIENVGISPCKLWGRLGNDRQRAADKSALRIIGPCVGCGRLNSRAACGFRPTPGPANLVSKMEPFWPKRIGMTANALSRSAAMHLHTYRDESRSGHLDLIGGRGHPWSIDLVAVTASGILLMGFACAVAALLVH